MKRKLVKQGGSALTVTLPIKWIKQQHLEVGDDVLLEERGGELLIHGHGEPESKRVTLDVRSLNERTIRWLLSGLHKSGYDEIELSYGDNKIAVPIIHELVRELLLGFAVMEQSDTRCVLRMLAKDSSNEFDATLRRAFLVTLSMADVIRDLSRRKCFTELHPILELEKTNNQLTNFCHRILNKNLYEGNQQTHFLYLLAWNLEKIGDIYKRLCEHLISVKKIDALEMEMLDKVTEQFRAYYELYYTFDVGVLSSLAERHKQLVTQIENALQTRHKENLALSYLLFLLTRCDNFSTSMFMLRQQAGA